MMRRPADRTDLALWLVLAVFAAVAVAYAFLSPGTYQDDDLDHYYVARQAWSDPALFLDRWAMPLVTLVFAVPARAFGYAGVETTTALLTGLAALFAGLAARRLGIPRPWLASARNWRTFYSMSDEPAFRCPVCRAAQTLRETCRRCQADLGLVARAHRRLAYVKRQQAQAQAGGDVERQRSLAAELLWLAPTR